MDSAASAAAVFLAPSTKPSEDGVSPYNPLTNDSHAVDPDLEGVSTELVLFFSGYRIRSEIWAIPLIFFAGLEMFLVACFEAYVVVRVVAGRAPYRNFYLNQVQLLGNFLLSSVALFYASDMNPMYCVVVRFGTGMSYAMVFAAMLVKSVYYLSAQNGVYLPSSYQALLLLFTLLPQVILGIQWLVLKPPSLVKVAAMSEANRGYAAASAPNFTTAAPPLFMSSAASAEPLATQAVTADPLHNGLVCGTPYRETVLALVYVMFLLAFVAAVSLRAKALKEAQGDQWWLGVTVAMCLLVWLAWVLTGAAVINRHKDGSLGLGLVAVSATVLILTAFPQGARLARSGSRRCGGIGGSSVARGSGGRKCSRHSGHCELECGHRCDGDDADSVAWDDDDESSASSLYSSSFFHYKPPVPKSMASDSLDRHNQQANGGGAQTLKAAPPKGRFTPDQKIDMMLPMKVKMPDGSVKKLVELPPNSRRILQQHRHQVHKPSKRSRYPSADNPEVFYLKGGIWSAAPMMY